eukprot:CAMPEP_0171307342 /NCGR_PEP_ID=MMETSP0816-20121228/17356_1 /TAXON_ID=420281 /ORGANISM="Proboscia inermis, Strain CCAP1064/1" /LENGTH=118 /DNA_ID=CAMNT_0011789443 /DNA_START=691 /DNA_END=1044 /DNA_ORIENTATION=+
MVKEVGIGAFARCEIDSADLSPHAMQDIYTFVGGEGEMAPDGVVKVVVDKSVESITEHNFGRRCDKITHFEFHSASTTIQANAFKAPSLREITFQENCNLNIEQRAFNNCKNITIIKW